MAISAVMFFENDPTKGDLLATYDAIIDEMGVRDNPASGGIYHWVAKIPTGLRICDVWESQDHFDRFAQTKIMPLTGKHGIAPPVLEIAPVHEMVVGSATSHKGCGVILQIDGDTHEVLRKIDEANRRMNANQKPPEGLIFHWSTPDAHGARVYDHWRSRADFDRFVETMLMPVTKELGVSQPRPEFFDVYNTIDKRVVTAVRA